MTDAGDLVPREAEFLLYRTEDGGVRLEVRFDGETVWLTQAAMAALFQTTPQNITQHIVAIYAEGELDETATCKPYLQVRQEVVGAGGRPDRGLPRAEGEGERGAMSEHRAEFSERARLSCSLDSAQTQG